VLVFLVLEVAEHDNYDESSEDNNCNKYDQEHLDVGIILVLIIESLSVLLLINGGVLILNFFILVITTTTNVAIFVSAVVTTTGVCFVVSVPDDNLAISNCVEDRSAKPN